MSDDDTKDKGAQSPRDVRALVDAKAGGAGEVELASAPVPGTPTEDALRRALSAVDAAMTDEAAQKLATASEETSAASAPPQPPAPSLDRSSGAAEPTEASAVAAAGSSIAGSATAGLAPTDARANRERETEVPTGGAEAMSSGKTQIVRGPRRPTRTDFHQEPVVAWLVVIGGPGLGAFRPLFTGNNTIGRSPNQRVPIDFGDDAISAEEQAYIRYDAADREFLIVPNLSKTNVVSVNDAKPTGALKLAPMDVITMGQTQLVFVPFCGEEFDWSELADL